MAESVESNVLFDVWLASRATTALLDAALAPSGLSADEFAIYSVLRRGPLTPSALAEWMSAPATTVSSFIRRFERRGHVQRLANPSDGRSYLVGLTPAGVGAHRAAGTAFSSVLRQVSDRLGPARPQVEAMLQRYRDSLA